MRIEKIGETALEIIRRNPHGTVHSVYKNTVNLSLGGELLAIQAAGTPMTPIALQSDIPGDTLWELFRAGESATVSKTAVTTGDISISISPSAEIYSGSLGDNLEPLQKGDFLSLLEDSLPAAGNRSIFSGLKFSDKLLSFAANTAGDITERGKSDPLLLPELIGLGPGLTPAGDDFIIGVLAALDLYKKEHLRASLGRKVAENLSKTGDISAAFLKEAANRRYSEHLLTLLKGPTAHSLSLAASSGHSSGADTLFGILFTLKYII